MYCESSEHTVGMYRMQVCLLHRQISCSDTERLANDTFVMLSVPPGHLMFFIFIFCVFWGHLVLGKKGDRS